jgi:transcription antitermination factor NusG
MNIQWYVLRSKPNKEMTLWRELNLRGFECYYPQLHVRPINPRSRTVRPYFPGYLFVHTELERVGTSTFQWMPFSSGFVSFDGEPATLPDPLVEAIGRHVDAINAAGGFHEQAAGLQPGEVVVIEEGPFKGYEAIFDTRLSGNERVRVLLKLLNRRDVNVELPATQIRRKG